MIILKTLRLVIPQWQGGLNPDYAFGARLLAFIAPPSNSDETVDVMVNEDFKTPLFEENGIVAENILREQFAETDRILQIKNPDRVIVFGGDCSVSQSPINYLSGKYGDMLGILWLDAHPDIATTKDTNHAHEMVLANLIGLGNSVAFPVNKNRVMYAGLIERKLRRKDRAVKILNIKFATPQDLTDNSDIIIDWIRTSGIAKLAVHFDLDVLSPADFRSNTCAKPYITRRQYGAAMGELTLNQVVRILHDVDRVAEIVGLCIAEHMPWDAINLRAALSQISLFTEDKFRK